jgi:hypothetical protein
MRTKVATTARTALVLLVMAGAVLLIRVVLVGGL